MYMSHTNLILPFDPQYILESVLTLCYGDGTYKTDITPTYLSPFEVDGKYFMLTANLYSCGDVIDVS